MERFAAILQAAGDGSATELDLLATMATSENLPDILLVYLNHFYPRPDSESIDPLYPSHQMLSISKCFPKLAHLMISHRDVQIVNATFREHWSSIWRWMEVLISKCILGRRYSEENCLNRSESPQLETAALFRDALSFGIVSFIYELITAPVYCHTFIPIMDITPSLTETTVGLWMESLRLSRARVWYTNAADKELWIIGLTINVYLCRHPPEHSVRKAFFRAMEEYDDTAALLLCTVSQYLGEIDVCPRVGIKELNKLRGIKYFLTIIEECSISSQKLQDEFFRLSSVIQLVEIARCLTSTHFLDYVKSDPILEQYGEILKLAINYVLNTFEKGIQWVTLALDHHFLIYIVRGCRLFPLCASYGSKMNVRSLQGIFSSAIYRITPYTLYPSVMRRVTRSVKTIERLGYVAKYDIAFKSDHDPEGSAKTISAAWAVLQHELTLNRGLEGQFLNCPAICYNKDCPSAPTMTVKELSIKKCSGCGDVYYCSQACQKHDWDLKPDGRGHIVSCKASKQGRRSMGLDKHFALNVLTSKVKQLGLDIVAILKQHADSKEQKKMTNPDPAPSTNEASAPRNGGQPVLLINLRRYPPIVSVIEDKGDRVGTTMPPELRYSNGDPRSVAEKMCLMEISDRHGVLLALVALPGFPPHEMMMTLSPWDMEGKLIPALNGKFSGFLNTIR